MGGNVGGRGVGRMEWSGGGRWDNCNSIINKYIFKKCYIKEKKRKENFVSQNAVKQRRDCH